MLHILFPSSRAERKVKSHARSYFDNRESRMLTVSVGTLCDHIRSILFSLGVGAGVEVDGNYPNSPSRCGKSLYITLLSHHNFQSRAPKPVLAVCDALVDGTVGLRVGRLEGAPGPTAEDLRNHHTRRQISAMGRSWTVLGRSPPVPAGGDAGSDWWLTPAGSIWARDAHSLQLCLRRPLRTVLAGLDACQFACLDYRRHGPASHEAACPTADRSAPISAEAPRHRTLPTCVESTAYRSPPPRLPAHGSLH